MLLSQKCAQKFEENERKKHISNLIQFFILQFFLRKRIRHSFPHFFYSKINYPITRKEQNKNYFLYFSQNSKHNILFWQESIFLSFNDVIKFINTQEENLFFEIFYGFVFINFSTSLGFEKFFLTCQKNMFGISEGKMQKKMVYHSIPFSGQNDDLFLNKTKGKLEKRVSYSFAKKKILVIKNDNMLE